MAHVSRVPARSGASQFALWASADDRYDTLSRVRTPGATLSKCDCLFNSAAFSDNLAITVLFVTATVTVFIFL